MKIKCLRAFAAVLIAAAALASGRSLAATSYRLHVDLDPAGSSLRGQARLEAPPCVDGRLLLYLNRSLAIVSASIDGAAATPQWDPPDAPASFLSRARPFALPCAREAAEIVYDGAGALSSDGRNQVSPALIELSLYGAWYPLVDTAAPVQGRLTIALPRGWSGEWASSATRRAVRRTPQGPRITLRWDAPTPDFTFIAAPAFERVAHPQGGVETLVSRGLAPAAHARAQAYANDAQRALDLYAAWLGRRPSGRATIAFTPRGGPLAYARAPLIVIQDERLTAAPETDPRSQTVNVRHEVAHFWSNAARTPQDDWINEGLAEFLALRATRALDGAEAHARLVAWTLAGAREAGEGFSAVDPGEQTYAGRYARPALFLTRLEAEIGEAAMTAFLRRLATARAPLTTAQFEAIARQSAPAAAATVLMACVRARTLSPECLPQ